MRELPYARWVLGIALLAVPTCGWAAPYVEPIAGFDSPWFGLRTELSGDVGVLNGECAEVVRDADRGCLVIRYDFTSSSDPGAYAGAWLSLRGPIVSSYVHLDLSRWDSLRFRVFGRAALVDGPGDGQQGTLLRVEVKDDRRSYARTAYRYVRIEPAQEWSEVILSARIDDPKAWRLNDQPPDPGRAKELVFVVERALNDAKGELRMDDLALVGAAADAGPAPADDHALLDQIAQASFRFFWDYADPRTGLMVDRSSRSSPFTIAGTGFALAAYCIGADRGYVTRVEAADRVRRALGTLSESPAGDSPTGCSRYQGFFYHFLGPDGHRDGATELSTVDTALLMCGVLTCKGYFNRQEEADIRRTAQRLVDEVSWPWMLAADGRIRHGWKPDAEMHAEWDVYTDEIILLNLLAIGSSSHPIPAETFYRWQRVPVDLPAAEFVPSFPGSLYTYTFASLWMSPRILDNADSHPTIPVNWWQNSRLAAQANYDYCRSRPALFGGAAWGLTACLGRVGDALVYHAYSAPPALEVRDGGLVRRDAPHAVEVSDTRGTRWVDDNTVIAPYGAASALPLLPEAALAALRHYREKPGLWHSADCGLADAYSEIDGYVNPEAYSIDAGPMLLVIDNYEAMRRGTESAVWRSFAGTPEIRRAVGLVWPAAPANPTPLP